MPNNHTYVVVITTRMMFTFFHFKRIYWHEQLYISNKSG